MDIDLELPGGFNIKPYYRCSLDDLIYSSYEAGQDNVVYLYYTIFEWISYHGHMPNVNDFLHLIFISKPYIFVQDIYHFRHRYRKH